MTPDRSNRALIAALRSALEEVAVPEDAAPMQAYMKSEMPYLGVKTPARRAACRATYRAFPLADFESWKATALDLWRDARYREERYAAIDLAAFPAYRKYRTREAFPMYREMVVAGAWWDLVDAVAVQQFPDLFRSDADFLTAKMQAWAASDDLWKRRSAIVSQIKRKADTDLDLLTAAIDPALEEQEFFLRKAIGWALREHAKTDASWVLRFVDERREAMSKLSKREALRNLLSKEELAGWL